MQRKHHEVLPRLRALFQCSTSLNTEHNFSSTSVLNCKILMHHSITKDTPFKYLFNEHNVTLCCLLSSITVYHELSLSTLLSISLALSVLWRSHSLHSACLIGDFKVWALLHRAHMTFVKRGYYMEALVLILYLEIWKVTWQAFS